MEIEYIGGSRGKKGIRWNFRVLEDRGRLEWQYIVLLKISDNPEEVKQFCADTKRLRQKTMEVMETIKRYHYGGVWTRAQCKGQMETLKVIPYRLWRRLIRKDI